MRKIVVPGELLLKSKHVSPYAFSEGESVYSGVLGLYDEEQGKYRLVALQGKYLPQVDDFVVAIVNDVKFSGYSVNINSPYSGFLLEEDRGVVLNIGDVVSARIKDVDEVKSVVLNDYRPLAGGMLVEISPVKIPRVVGKQGSMIKMLKDYTHCDMVVGKNGRIWIRGENALKLREAILKIEREAHTSGLTNRIKDFFEKGVK